MKPRTSSRSRATSETSVEASINLDGTGKAGIATGIGFLDHLLTALARHARIDITLACDGDLHIDDHHTAEDCALAFGAALDEALGDKSGIARFGDAHAPLDESLARAVIDLSGRPNATVNLDLRRDMIGGLSCEMVPHVFASMAMAGRFTLHLDVLRGDNDHHKAEAAMKAFARALRQAIARDGSAGIPSTKGTLQ